MRREAIASSRIEGTQAELPELLIDEVQPASTPVGSDVLEVRNYVAAMNTGLRAIAKMPIAGRVVRDLHCVLMKGVRGQEKTPGEFRRSQNWIGAEGSDIARAVYVPPPPSPEMLECLRHWEGFVNQRGTMPELVQCALMHEHFEAIHPFNDGNGRIGRLLITLFLVERKRLSKPLLYLSTYIERHKSGYYERLQRVRTDGDWEGWLRYFLIAVRETASNAIAQSDALLRLRDQYRAKVGKNLRSLALLDTLFINPYTSTNSAALHLDVSTPTASKTIAILEKAGMLREVTGKGWGRLWVARPILKAIQFAPAEQPQR